jgi:hypothetical protein
MKTSKFSGAEVFIHGFIVLLLMTQSPPAIIT